MKHLWEPNSILNDILMHINLIQILSLNNCYIEFQT